MRIIKMENVINFKTFEVRSQLNGYGGEKRQSQTSKDFNMSVIQATPLFNLSNARIDIL